MRGFIDKQIPKQVLTEIIETAGQAPSWSNSQPWEVFVVSGEKMKKIQERWAKEITSMLETGNINFDGADMRFPGYDD